MPPGTCFALLAGWPGYVLVFMGIFLMERKVMLGS
jgi:hypothetical protein